LQRFLEADPAWLGEQGQIDAVRNTMRFLVSPQHGAVYSTVNGGPGLSSMATSHSAFDTDPATLASVATFIAS
jgi:hypothetical protein